MVTADGWPHQWFGERLWRGRSVRSGWMPRLGAGERVLGQEEEEEEEAVIETRRVALGSR